MKALLTNTLKRNVNAFSWRDGAGMDSFNYGLACIAAVAENAGHDIKCPDLHQMNLTEDGLRQTLKGMEFDVIGISFYTPQTDMAQKTAAIAKQANPGCKVVFGGIHVTSLPEETMKTTPEVDVCVIGEGDYTFTELLDSWENGSHLKDINGIVYRNGNGEFERTKPRTAVRDLDDLPRPAYHLWPMREYQTSPNITYRYPTVSFQVTRGCPFKCTFCDYTTIGGSKVRHKSISNIIEEIEYLRDVYGYRGLVFRDSTLTVRRKFMIELCEAMIESNLDMPWMCYSRTDIRKPRELFRLMKKAGCWQVGFGCESGNQKTLDMLKKSSTVEQNRDTVRIAYEVGLSVSTTWMIALPGETEADAKNTIDFALSLPTHIAKFFLPVPYPRTELAESCRMDGGLQTDLSYINYDMYDQNNPVYVNPLIGAERSVKLLRSAYRRFYTSPKTWKLNLEQLRDMDMALRYWRGLSLMVKS